MSREDWMAQNSKNQRIVDLGDLISRGMDIKEKDGYYWVEGERDGEDAKTRGYKYKQVAPRLEYRFIAQLFALNRSVMAIQSWSERKWLDGKDPTAMRCAEKLGCIRRLFGSYSFVDARESWSAYSEKALSRPMFPTELHTEPPK
ncbi:hypothetical protein EON83_21620 [bacterium]|nr:MAG: hypothetical protein EON83_21620 [bacterium]